MKNIFLCTLLAAACTGAWADGPSDCAAAAGSYITGKVVSGPRFAYGKSIWDRTKKKSVELSHTKLYVISDKDRSSYQVAIDNVYATGYDAAGETVPTPLNTIQVGDRVELCGQLYTDGTSGIHWVHSNCGAKPTPQAPNGWVKKFNADGSLTPSFTASQEYCSLWAPRGQ